MKEATGELSGTVITVVAIAAVVAIFTTILLPMIKNNIELGSACDTAGQGSYSTTLDDGATIVCASGTCTLTRGQQATVKTCENPS